MLFRSLSNGDKILSENYFQHADHFLRIINEKSNNQFIENLEKNKSDSEKIKNFEEKQDTPKILSST